MKFSEYNNDFDLKDVILEANNMHNHKIHSSTGFSPCDTINNINEDIPKKVLGNIEKIFKNHQ